MAIQSLKPHVGLQPVWDNNPLNIPAPVGAWVMNEGSGAWSNDLSCFGNHINSFTNTAWVPGGVKGSTTGALLTTADANLSAFDFGTGPYTVATGFNYVDNGSYQYFCAFDNYDPGFAIYLYDDFYVYDSSSKVFSFNISDGNDYSAAFVRYDTGATGLRFFLDGKLDPQARQHSDSISGHTSLTILNSDPSNALGYGFVGTMYYLYIFNKALTQAQVDFIHINPYYAWDYLNDTLIAIVAAQAAAGGLSIPRPLSRPFTGPLGGI